MGFRETKGFARQHKERTSAGSWKRGGKRAKPTKDELVSQATDQLNYARRLVLDELAKLKPGLWWAPLSDALRESHLRKPWIFYRPLGFAVVGMGEHEVLAQYLYQH